MKKIFAISLIVIALAISFSACKTYDEGPSLSVLTPKMRIKGTWNQTALYINDNLQDNNYKLEFSFDGDGTGTRTNSLGTISNKVDIMWQFNDDKTILLVKEPNASQYDEMKILRLTNKEMWTVVDAGLLGMWQYRYEKV